MTDHTFVSFPDAKGFFSKKTIIGEMWFERLSREMISTSSPMFATEWPGFHKFKRGPSLLTFFSGSLLVVGHGLFASTVLNYRKSAFIIATSLI